MAIETEQEPHSIADVLTDLQPADVLEGPRRAGGLGKILLGVLVVSLVGVPALAYLGYAVSSGGNSAAMLTYRVQPAGLLVTVTEDGNLESAANVDIKCEVAGGSTILSIVKDGELVKKGTVLARLDSSQLEDQINQQKITYEKARADLVQAEKDFSVAKISVQEYLEGTYRQSLQDLDAQITIAMENLRASENVLQHTERMFRKGYVSPLQLQTQQFAVERAKLDLASANTAKEVLEKFTKLKTIEDLESKRDTAEAKKESQKAAFDLEEARLKRLQAQLDKCVIKAPSDGMVVYANDAQRGHFSSQQPQIEEGAMVREQQTMFRLPDLSQMQVKVTVHESKVDSLREGMRARIRVQDHEFQGTVDSVANQPEPSSWFSASVKEYATSVKIDGQPQHLRPGMTAEVEILVAQLKSVLTLPVAAVVEQRGKLYCWVRRGNRIERRPLVLGLNNDKFVEVKDGVAAGDEVLLNPRALVAEARAEEPGAEPVDVGKKFGTPAEGKGPASPKGAGQRPAGTPAGGKSPQEPSGALPGSPPPGPRPEGGPPSGPPGAAGGSRNLMDLDKDGDGKISRQEAPERMQEFFDRIDANQDGFLDQGEIGQMRNRARRGGPPGAEGGPPPGAAPR